MSYEITFKNIPEQDMKKYDVLSYQSGYNSTPSSIRYEIIESCMKYKEKHKGNIRDLQNSLFLNLTFLIDVEAKKAKHRLYSEYESEDEYSPKGCITICGTNYRGHSFGSSNDNDSVLGYCLENLVKIGALVDTPDYWEERGHWDEKYDEICEVLDYCESEAYENEIKDFISKFYKYSDEYEEEQEKNEFLNDNLKELPFNCLNEESDE